ncbi:lactadherin-like isoform X3 [Montipora foliosa]|uniref:lactadherin-like isoform X2 n=1 Tax=Montipora foliosa TaxID=591990 RepID=UPI0035F15CD5
MVCHPLLTLIMFGVLCPIPGTADEQDVEDDNGCFEPLGIQAGEFDDGEIAASSTGKNFTSTDAWCPPKVDENQYIQVDLSRKTELTKIATQGESGIKDRFVKTFSLLYSDNGKKWEQYGSKGTEKIFQANNDSFTVHHNTLEKPLVTRYIRINPRTWENAICMRLEVFGCDV